MERFLGLPEAASAHAPQIDHVNGMVHLLMLILFVLWGSLFAYILFRFRAKKNPQASYQGLQSHASSYAEVAVAVVEVVLLVGFSIPLYSERVDNLPTEEEAIVVRVVGEQFAWNIHYPGADGEFGSRMVELIDAESNPLGLDSEDPKGEDDISNVNQLHLVVNKPALIYLSTKDVIHNFSNPEMRVKQDAVPGLEFPIWFIPTVTTEEMRKIKGNDKFNYEIACAQLCGLGHSRMRGFITVHTQEGYDAWMNEQVELLAEEEGDDFWG
jgi:cytochrome c oxidase subunit 2